MRFNSCPFRFVFLPLVLAGFAVLTRWRTCKTALAAALTFYAWWKQMFLSLIVFSILFNFLLGRRLQRWAEEVGAATAPARRWMVLGLA